MVEQVREELKELCEKILADRGDDLRDQLSSVQMLYEKLLILNYLQEQNNAAEADQIPAKGEKKDVEQEETPPKSLTPDRDVPPKIHKQEEFINESPVVDEELRDDKTPAEMGPIMAAISDIRAEGKSSERKASINYKLKQGSMKVGLNDRLAFVKHLFQGNQEDFNRVVSQINTFESYEEAENFLEKIVKPDYDWSKKEEYEIRFIQLMRDRFGIV